MAEDDQAAEVFRRDFLRRLDELSERVAQLNDLVEGLLELGHLLVLALGDAARANAGNPVGNLLGTLDKVATAWRETMAQMGRRKR